MLKYFVLNIVLSLAIVFLVYSGFEGYKAGNMLVTGLSIAFLVVLIYLRVVLSKRVRALIQEKESGKKQQPAVKQKKK
ncbi:DUF6358 family protein [Sphingobacterium sp.]|uniref:DUF6358 family protein n=1 Tax=Sphingobacterium sp. TaxID=341027 RepID=UPI0028973F52|nr:DUF6358 family protein [Sphingobacterium sp.]